MAYLSLYRKYRSQTFSDLIGQDHVVRTLQNAIASGRIAHSYLFTGPRGTGKTSSARLLAKALCCEKGPTPEPCNECDICREITAGSLVDVFEMDAASESGVDEVRETIVEGIQYRPNFARYRIFIIDEVHDLSAKAFDALLKTIEEPPDHVIFILATTEYNKVPPTIRSRCQKFEFHRASMTDLVNRLAHVAAQEGMEAEMSALTAIARMADGGYRDALTLLEQAMLTSEGTITLQQVYDQLGLIGEDAVDDLLLAMRDGDIAKLISRLTEIARLGRDPRSVLESMLYRLADLTRAMLGVDVGATMDATREASMRETATRLGRDEILRLRSAVSGAHRVIRDVSLPRMWLEAELTRIAIEPKASMAEHAPAKAAAPVQPQKPVVQQSKPPVVREEPAPPKPQPAEPKGAAPVEETAAPQAAAKEGDLWSRVRHELGALSNLMKVRLAGTRLGPVEGNRYTVEFERQIDLDWVLQTAKRQAAIVEKLSELSGAPSEIEYVVRVRERKETEPVTVELPLEGQALHNVAKREYGG